MKKLLLLLAALLMIVTVTACASNTPTVPNDTEQTGENEPQPYKSNCGDVEKQIADGEKNHHIDAIEPDEQSEEVEPEENETDVEAKPADGQKEEEEKKEEEKAKETKEDEKPKTEETPKTVEEPSDGDFADTLASKTTSLTDNDNRNNNVSLAAQAINGLVMNPGETFSFNGTVGQRTTGKGYKEAGAFANGKTVYEVGGGICQVSSTLYYCTLLADLKIVDRDCHMFPVSYLPLGMDATVSWGGPDFKFRNNTDYPIKLVAYVDGLSLHVSIKGTKANDHTFEMSSDIVSTKDYKTIEKESDEVTSRREEVSGVTGYTVDTYRTEYDGNGNAIETEYIDRSVYRSRDAVILVPKTYAPDPEPEPEPEPEPDPEPIEYEEETGEEESVELDETVEEETIEVGE